MIPRPSYIERIRPFIGQDVVKVFTGMRRSGKSTLLKGLQDILVSDGVPSENIVSMNFESLKWERAAGSHRAFYEAVIDAVGEAVGRVYLFFDEIQVVSEWERAIGSLRVDLDCDIYLTGSNSKLLSGELSTLLAGRYVSFEVFPFSLRELASAGEGTDPSAAYAAYRVYGGLPFLSHISYEPNSSLSYLQDVFNSIVLKDIVQRHGFRNSDQLERILSYFMSEVGTTYSVDNLANVFKEEKRAVSVDSIYNYLKAAEEAMLLKSVRRYDIKGKEILRGSEKVYLTDIGLREAMLGTNATRVDLILENLVFIELRRRGFDVYIGRIGKKEVDFVAERNGTRLYVQVAYLLESEKTREREFSSLEAIGDNHPKIIVSADEADWSRDGIRCWNIVDFLMSDAW